MVVVVVVATALVEEEEEEVEEEDGGGSGVVASGEALGLPSGSEERAEDRDGGCRYLPPPSLQLVTSEHTCAHTRLSNLYNSRLIKLKHFLLHYSIKNPPPMMSFLKAT